MHRSRLTAALIDVPASDYEGTAAFWSRALGRAPQLQDDADYVALGEATPGLEVYVQRIDGPARLHVDLETDDVDAEVGRLTGLGARVVERQPRRVILADPGGLLFCVVEVQLPESFERHATVWNGEQADPITG